MSIRERSKFGRSRSCSATHTPGWREAFTLIELLVVVAILALLMSILLPSLRCARESARKVVCGTTLNGFGKSLALYINDNDDWFPGINTTGAALMVKQFSGNADPDKIRDPNLPVQTFDWITPLVRYSEGGLPANRGERWEHIWQKRYACPSRGALKSVIYDINGLPDEEDFEDIEWKACSYLMPAYFSYWGDQVTRQTPRMEMMNSAIPIFTPQDNWNVRSVSFFSRMDRVGGAGLKVFAADGTRYLPANDEPLDHQATPWAFTFGAFTSGGAWWAGSTAYGVGAGSQNWDGTTMNEGSPADGANLAMSYRHGCGESGTSARSNGGKINALFFDGHVSAMGDRESRSITLWYPTGSIVRSNTNGLTDVENGFVIP